MNLRQLQFFVTLAETLNFNRAARQLNMTQPPLTVAIRKLEEELGVDLFTRGARGVTLTSAGMAALAPARDALAFAKQVLRVARQAAQGERGRLTIGFVGSATFELMPRLIQPFRLRYPDVELVLEEGTSVDIHRRIEAGVLDIGLVRLPLLEHSAIRTAVIERDTLVAALPGSHPFARRRETQLAELADQPFVVHSSVSILRSTVIVACQNAGFVPRVTQEATQVSTILSLVQSGLGISLVPSRAERFAPEGIVLVPLALPVEIAAGVAYASHHGPLVEQFLGMALASIDT